MDNLMTLCYKGCSFDEVDILKLKLALPADYKCNLLKDKLQTLFNSVGWDEMTTELDIYIEPLVKNLALRWI